MILSEKPELKDALSHSIRPPFAHTTSFSSLQTATRTAARHTVGDAMRVLGCGTTS